MTTASIVTYNTSGHDLKRVMQSALASPIDTLYIIDHSPGDDVKRFFDVETNDQELREMLTDKRVVFEQHPNRGYGAGHNIAIKRSMDKGAEYHAILNPDIYWTDPVIATLTAYMDSHPEIGMMTPKVLFPDGRLQFNCKLLPTPLDLIGRRFLPKRLMKRRNDRFELHFTGYDQIMNVPYIHGCFMFMRISTLRKTGLFDERFFMYPEDIDITRRIHRVAQSVFYPGVSLYHAHGAASHKFNKMLWIHIINMIRYFNKWGWWRDKERKKMNRALLARYLQSK